MDLNYAVAMFIVAIIGLAITSYLFGTSRAAKSVQAVTEPIDIPMSITDKPAFDYLVLPERVLPKQVEQSILDELLVRQAEGTYVVFTEVSGGKRVIRHAYGTPTGTQQAARTLMAKLRRDTYLTWDKTLTMSVLKVGF